MGNSTNSAHGFPAMFADSLMLMEVDWLSVILRYTVLPNLFFWGQTHGDQDEPGLVVGYGGYGLAKGTIPKGG